MAAGTMQNKATAKRVSALRTNSRNTRSLVLFGRTVVTTLSIVSAWLGFLAGVSMQSDTYNPHTYAIGAGEEPEPGRHDRQGDHDRAAEQHQRLGVARVGPDRGNAFGCSFILHGPGGHLAPGILQIHSPSRAASPRARTW